MRKERGANILAWVMDSSCTVSMVKVYIFMVSKSSWYFSNRSSFYFILASDSRDFSGTHKRLFPQETACMGLVLSGSDSFKDKRLAISWQWIEKK